MRKLKYFIAIGMIGMIIMTSIFAACSVIVTKGSPSASTGSEIQTDTPLAKEMESKN